MELETINKLYLELAQFATAKIPRQMELELDLGQAHHVLDIMRVPRTDESGSQLTLLGRMRKVQDLIGVSPEGSHPDEQLPRSSSWHRERLNWIAETKVLREYIERISK